MGTTIQFSPARVLSSFPATSHASISNVFRTGPDVEPVFPPGHRPDRPDRSDEPANVDLSRNMGTTIQFSPARVLSSFPATSHRKPPHRSPKNSPPTLSLLIPPTSVTTKHNDNHEPHRLKFDTTNNDKTTSSKTVYRDNWLENMAIAYLSKKMQETAGMFNDEPGYKGLVTASAAVSRELSPSEQRAVVLKVLENAVPSFMIKKMRFLPNSKFTREYFAIFTTVAFRWLVGPSEVRELEFEGKKERNVVHITKCRFLEEANCVGMCTNLCKMPTQEFIKKSFGIPANMVPNFDDMSCEIIFGQDPPAQEDDAAFKEPCYKLCDFLETGDKASHRVVRGPNPSIRPDYLASEDAGAVMDFGVRPEPFCLYTGIAR